MHADTIQSNTLKHMNDRFGQHQNAWPNHIRRHTFYNTFDYYYYYFVFYRWSFHEVEVVRVWYENECRQKYVRLELCCCEEREHARHQICMRNLLRVQTRKTRSARTNYTLLFNSFYFLRVFFLHLFIYFSYRFVCHYWSITAFGFAHKSFWYFYKPFSDIIRTGIRFISVDLIRAC